MEVESGKDEDVRLSDFKVGNRVLSTTTTNKHMLHWLFVVFPKSLDKCFFVLVKGSRC